MNAKMTDRERMWAVVLACAGILLSDVLTTAVTMVVVPMLSMYGSEMVAAYSVANNVAQYAQWVCCLPLLLGGILVCAVPAKRPLLMGISALCGVLSLIFFILSVIMAPVLVQRMTTIPSIVSQAVLILRWTMASRGVALLLIYAISHAGMLLPLSTSARTVPFALFAVVLLSVQMVSPALFVSVLHNPTIVSLSSLISAVVAAVAGAGAMVLLGFLVKRKEN